MKVNLNIKKCIVVIGLLIGQTIAASAIAEDKSYGLGVICLNVDTTTLKKLRPSTEYLFEWWNLKKGIWQDASRVTTDRHGMVAMPQRPDDKLNWAYRIQVTR